MKIIQYLINGISIGSVYAIIALGYTMVYGIAKMLNFAHGDVIMVGAYISFCVTNYLGLPVAVSILAAMAVCTLLGVLIEGLAYKPLRGTPSLAVLITAIGVSYFLQNAAQLIWSSSPKNFTSIVTFQPLRLAGGQLVVTGEVIYTIAASIIIMLGLTWFTTRTRTGKAMRAVSEDRDAAQLMGINVNQTISMTFAIGSALAAVAHSNSFSEPSPVCCFAPPFRPCSPPPAPCPVSAPLPRRSSAASAPFPAPCWAAFCWASLRPSARPISAPSSATRSCLPS